MSLQVSSVTEFSVRILSEQDMSADNTQVVASGREHQWEGEGSGIFHLGEEGRGGSTTVLVPAPTPYPQTCSLVAARAWQCSVSEVGCFKSIAAISWDLSKPVAPVSLVAWVRALGPQEEQDLGPSFFFRLPSFTLPCALTTTLHVHGEIELGLSSDTQLLTMVSLSG